MDEPNIEINVTPPAAEIDDAAETVEEIEDVSEQLALQAIITEEQHQEILERVTECNTRLEALSTGESPTLAAMQAEMVSIRSEIAAMVQTLVAVQASLIPTQSVSVMPLVSTEPEEPEAEELIAEPEPDAAIPEPPPAPKKNRFI